MYMSMIYINVIIDNANIQYYNFFIFDNITILIIKRFKKEEFR